MFKSKKKQDTQLANIIVEGTVIKGNINSEVNTRIDGVLEGNVYCNSNLWVGKSSVIKGDIMTKSGVLEGQVKGKIKASESLSLKATTQITGDVETKGLKVEEGATIRGNYITGTYASPSEKKLTEKPINKNLTQKATNKNLKNEKSS